MFYKEKSSQIEFEAGDITKLKELVHPIKDNVSIGYSLAEARLCPGESSLPHRLNSSELYYILEGKGEIVIDNQIQKIAKGDVVLVPAKAEQHVKNLANEDLIFLCIVEPYWKEQDEEII
jgi:mannose-6-phosphate isomerase-like protein (cupin superfamily)